MLSVSSAWRIWPLESPRVGEVSGDGGTTERDWVPPTTRMRSAPRSIAGLNGVLRCTPPSMYQSPPILGSATQRGGKTIGKADEASRCWVPSRVLTYRISGLEGGTDFP